MKIPSMDSKAPGYPAANRFRCALEEHWCDMVTIEISNNQRHLTIDRRWFKGLAEHVLAAQDIENAYLSIAFVDNRTVHKINRQFLAHDYPTDVITFPLSAADGPNFVADGIQGEIVISGEYAVEACTSFEWSAQIEAGLYLVHGILHLCGFDDHEKADAARMRRRQRKLLDEYRGPKPSAEKAKPSGERSKPSAERAKPSGERAKPSAERRKPTV